MSDSPDAAPTDQAEAKAPLVLVRGDASPEEVAALVAVLQAASTASAAPPPATPRSEWSANHRKVRPVFHHGPSGWRSSGMPR